eukprot:GHVS01046429.1.p1 GENE.GHVS01046429.1~~GHVS01046429.1.p1  ORF type:complete len:579 (+),score=96.48 GHVS01046429.1:430-2166(+)
MDSFDCSYSSWDELEVPHGLSLSYLMDEVLRHLQVSSNYTPSSSSSSGHAAGSRLTGLADWQADFVVLSYVQVLAKYSPHTILPHLEHICPILATLCNNLRSSVCKNALLAVAYLARGIPFPYFTPCVTSFLPTLITRSLSDKRFISDSAWLACTTITGPYASCETTVYALMHVSHQQKANAQFVAKCSELLKLAIKSILAPPPLPNSPPSGTSPAATPSYPSPSAASSLLLSSSDTTDTTPETASPSSTDDIDQNCYHQDVLANSGMRLYHQQGARVGPQVRTRAVSGQMPRSPELANSGGPHTTTAAGGRRPLYPNTRSISSPQLPSPVRGGGGHSPGGGGGAHVSRGSVFLRGIGTILSSYLTGRLPATKTAARQTISLMVSYFGEEHVKQCLLQNGNVDVQCGASSQGGAMGVAGLTAVHGPSRDALLRAINDAVCAAGNQPEPQRRPAANNRGLKPPATTAPTFADYPCGTNAAGSNSRGGPPSVGGGGLRAAAPSSYAQVHRNAANNRGPPSVAVPAGGGVRSTKATSSTACLATHAQPPAFRRPLQLPHTMMPDGSRFPYPHPTPPSYYGQ